MHPTRALKTFSYRLFLLFLVTKETESLCDLSAAKRMLNGLGINSSKTSCLLQSKRGYHYFSHMASYI